MDFIFIQFLYYNLVIIDIFSKIDACAFWGPCVRITILGEPRFLGESGCKGTAFF